MKKIIKLFLTIVVTWHSWSYLRDEHVPFVLHIDYRCKDWKKVGELRFDIDALT
jgi:hypothetical protein